MDKKSKYIFYGVLSAVLFSIFMFMVIERAIMKKEVEAVVNEVIEKIPFSSRAGDPDMSTLKEQLYELKRAYSDYSYEEILELIDTIESEQDYYDLLKRGKGKISYPVIAGAVIFAAVCGSVAGFKVTEKIRENRGKL